MSSRSLSFLGALLERRTAPATTHQADATVVYRQVLLGYRELEGTALAQFGLSLREHDVATELMHGATYREAARTLRIAESTVRFHAQNVFRKAKVTDRHGFERRFHAWINQWAED